MCCIDADLGMPFAIPESALLSGGEMFRVLIIALLLSIPVSAEAIVFKASRVAETFLQRHDRGVQLKAAVMGGLPPEAVRIVQTSGGNFRTINTMVNRVRYMPDYLAYGKDDWWATPKEFFEKGGDCEDYAIAKMLMFNALGVPWEDMFLTICVIPGGEVHCVLVSRGLVYDNRTDDIRPWPKDYKPLFAYSATGSFFIDRKASPTLGNGMLLAAAKDSKKSRNAVKGRRAVRNERSAKPAKATQVTQENGVRYITVQPRPVGAQRNTYVHSKQPSRAVQAKKSRPAERAKLSAGRKGNVNTKANVSTARKGTQKTLASPARKDYRTKGMGTDKSRTPSTVKAATSAKKKPAVSSRGQSRKR